MAEETALCRFRVRRRAFNYGSGLLVLVVLVLYDGQAERAQILQDENDRYENV